MISSTISFYLEGEFGFTIYEHQSLKIPIHTSRKHSGSVVISLAEFLMTNFRGLLPPKYDSEHHLLVSTWSEIICEAIINGSSRRIGQTLFVRAGVDEAYQQKLLLYGFVGRSQFDLSWPLEPQDYPQSAKYVHRKQKNVLLLLTSHNTRALDRPRIDLQALYLGTYFNNERWHVFRILEKDHPPEQVFNSADVIIMPGSNLSVYEGHPHIEQLKTSISHALKRKSTTKFLGVCFGAQFMSYLFGGDVKKAKNCTKKLETLQLYSHKISEHPYLEPLSKVQKLRITEYHGDEITDIPQGFNLVAASESCPTELIASKCNRYFGMQCHPDYNIEYLNRYFENFSLYMNQAPPQPYEGVDEASVLRECITKFLHAI